MGFEYSMDKITKFEFARTYNFKVTLSQIPIIEHGMIISCGTPRCSYEGIASNWVSAPIEIIGKPAFDPIILTLREKQDGEIYRAFYKWFSLCIDLEGKSLTTKPFSKIVENSTMEIIQLKSDGSESIKYELTGVYPENTPTTIFSYEESGIIIYEINLKYINYVIK